MRLSAPCLGPLMARSALDFRPNSCNTFLSPILSVWGTTGTESPTANPFSLLPLPATNMLNVVVKLFQEGLLN